MVVGGGRGGEFGSFANCRIVRTIFAIEEGFDCSRDGTSLRILFMVGDLELNWGEAIWN